MSGNHKIIDADVLIVGSGLAGLLLALKLATTTDLSLGPGFQRLFDRVQ